MTAFARDMSQDDALALLKQACDDLIAYYLNIACPCAFPRFRFLAGFLGEEDMNKVSDTLVHAFDTNVLISSVVRSGFLSDTSTCKVCGTVYEHEYEQFSITFEETTLHTKSLKATQVGSEPTTPTPLFAGLYWVNDKDPNIPFQYVTLEAFDQYMREVA